MHNVKRLGLYAFIAFQLLSFNSFSQTKVSGKVTEKGNDKPMGSVSVYIPGTTDATFTDAKGRFNFSTNRKLPFRVVFSSIGYAADTVEVAANDSWLNVMLAPGKAVVADEVVVSASRFAESYLQSPVTIEKINARAITQLATPNYFDAIKQLKGVDMTTSSLLFSVPITRGFASSTNYGVNQFIDGMDNSVAGLNFALGSFYSIPELDVASVELLPGASSALYGAGGVNGTIQILGKDPFQYQGVSAMGKVGLMHIGEDGQTAQPYQEYAVRYAKAVSKKLAFKINADYIKAYDWMPYDYRNMDGSSGLRVLKPGGGTRETDPGYDGVNVYGDETGANMQDVGKAMVAANAIPAAALAVIPNQYVTRTGYKEKDLVDYNTYSLRLNGMLSYRIKPGLTANLQANYGRGSTIWLSADRYALKEVYLGQYKLELKGNHFLLKAYTTQDDAGKGYNASALGKQINEVWSPSQNWFGEYVGAYLQATGAGAGNDAAQNAARAYADRNMPKAGSDQFNTIKDKLISTHIPYGAQFVDKGALYHYEGIYDFSHLTKVFQLQAGASYRRNHVVSDGTIFDDTSSKLTIDQIGAFVQATKKLLNDKVKITGAARYDKIQNFDGRWTPRAAVVYTFLPENNLRFSYQTGYRAPSTPDQYLDLNVTTARLLGGLPQMYTKYNLQPGSTNPGFTTVNMAEYGAVFAQELQKNMTAGDPELVAQGKAAIAAEKVLVPFAPKEFKPETVEAFELGYRGLVSKKLLVDAYAFINNHSNFIGNVTLLQAKSGPQKLDPNDSTKYYGPQLGNPATRDVYIATVNLDGTIKVFGWGIGTEYAFYKRYMLNTNVSYNTVTDAPAGFRTYFNSPSYRVNIGISNDNVYRNLGFNVAYRYQSPVFWQSAFGDMDIPDITTVDAMVSYKVPTAKLSFKIGATNLLNKYYRSASGTPSIGGLYYLTIGYNL
jgi:iron complex outermembrane receptor protein